MANKACKFSYTCEFSRQECRDLPPLVDELAEALYWLLNLHHNVSKAGNDPETGQPYPVTGEEWKAAIDEGMRVHARYQKEE